MVDLSPVPKDLALKLEALALLAVFQVGLALFSFQRVSRWQRRLMGEVEPTHPEPLVLEKRVRAAIRRSNKRVYGARCLADALAGQTMLGRRGVPSELKIGVQKKEGKLDAHAWLEREGRAILGGGELDVFTRLEGVDSRR